MIVKGVVVDAVGETDKFVRRIGKSPVVDSLQEANQDTGELQVETFHVLGERVGRLHCRLVLEFVSYRWGVEY